MWVDEGVGQHLTCYRAENHTMTIRHSGTGFLAVQRYHGPRGPVNVAGWGASRLEAMEACGNTVAELDHKEGPCSR